MQIREVSPAHLEDRAHFVPLSQAVREQTQQEHTEAERSLFMENLLRGRLTRAAYAAFVAQHYYIYLALEDAGERLASDPIAQPFVSAKLLRIAALERDLEFLYGPEWIDQVAPLPATETYVARIRAAAAEHPALFVAHHYTRYLGDLSGGQHIGRVVDRTYDLTERGSEFYRFEQIPDPTEFKNDYRAKLDAMPLDRTKRAAMLDEVRTAYALNTELFRELDATYPTVAD